METSETVRALDQWLLSYLNFEKLPQKGLFWLSTMEFLCGRLSHPEAAVPCFHVGGSKGKGSVSAMISSILAEAGYKAGLYTSPHLESLAERVSTPDGLLPERVYASAFRTLKAEVESLSQKELPGGRPLTWFELVTLFGMLCFREAGLDYAVYEVGLGGRLDATNVVTPLCSCIGPIELEHTEFLGDTVEKIAAEKAGIIKPGVPVVVAPQKSRSARNVFVQKAKELGSPVIFVDKMSKISKTVYENVLTNGRKLAFFPTERSVCSSGALSGAADRSVAPVSMEVTIRSPLFSRPLVACMRMAGDVQAWNAALAAVAVKTAVPSVSEEAVERGLSRARLPARFQVETCVPGVPFMVVDGAHTVGSVSVTLRTLGRLVGKRGMASLHVLYASAADKDVEDIALLFRGRSARMTLTRPGASKACDMERLCAAFHAAGISARREDDTENAFRSAVEAAREDGAPLLVAGSFYLAAEVLGICRRQGLLSS